MHTEIWPTWFCLWYLRQDKISMAEWYVVCFLAAARVLVSVMLWPVDLTWKMLMAADTMLPEMMALGSEILFLLWLWLGELDPHAELVQMLPMWAWTLIMLLMIGDHIHCIRSRDRDLRAMAMALDVFGYMWLSFVVLRSQFYFGEVFLWIFALAGGVVVLSLRSSPSGGAGGRQQL